MAPSLITSYAVYSAGADSSTLSTPSFTPSNGEIIIVHLMTWDTAHGMNAPTGGAQTYSAIGTAAPGGFNGWCAVYAATVSGSPGSMQVSATTDGTSTRHTMIVERWAGAQLAVSPATNATKNGSGSTTATTTLTTAADNSAVSWCMVDVASRDPAASAYVTTSGTVTQDGLYDGHVGSNSVHYSAYQTAATAGSQTFGITNSSNLTWVAVGVEILAGITAVSSADTGSGADAATLAATITATDTASTTEATALTAALSGADVATGRDSGITDAPIASITVSAGGPQRAWAAGSPGPTWATDPLQRAWAAGSPQRG